MIFVTVGAQMPFDRLVRAVDEWARHHRTVDVLAQIGPTGWRPSSIRWVQFLSPPQFRQTVEGASAVIAHAGMGSILTALELGKPIVVMPRRGDLRETRNDHQVATARHFLSQGQIAVAFDEHHLIEKLDELNRLSPAARISSQASPQLLKVLNRFVHTEVRRIHRQAGLLRLVKTASTEVPR